MSTRYKFISPETEAYLRSLGFSDHIVWFAEDDFTFEYVMRPASTIVSRYTT